MEWYDIVLTAVSFISAIVSVIFAIKAKNYFLKTDEIEKLIELKKCETIVWDAVNLVDQIIQQKRPECSGRGDNPDEKIPDICTKLNYKINELKKELNDSADFPLFAKEKEFNAINEIITGREELSLSQAVLWSSTMTESANWLKTNLNGVKRKIVLS